MRQWRYPMRPLDKFLYLGGGVLLCAAVFFLGEWAFFRATPAAQIPFGIVVASYILIYIGGGMLIAVAIMRDMRHQSSERSDQP